MIEIVREISYLAIYFCMGMYNEDDGIPELVGFDCPCDDSLVLKANDERSLERKIGEVYDGNCPSYFEATDPDVITDSKGVIQIDLSRRLFSDPDYHPNLVKYSMGRETLTELWEREKWRWV